MEQISFLLDKQDSEKKVLWHQMLLNQEIKKNWVESIYDIFS